MSAFREKRLKLPIAQEEFRTVNIGGFCNGGNPRARGKKWVTLRVHGASYLSGRGPFAREHMTTCHKNEYEVIFYSSFFVNNIHLFPSHHPPFLQEKYLLLAPLPIKVEMRSASLRSGSDAKSGVLLDVARTRAWYTQAGKQRPSHIII